MPYIFLYFNKFPKGSGIQERNFELASHLVDEINMRLETSGNESDYQTPIKLSEIKLFDVESIGYSFRHLTKPRLLYLPRSFYDAALKKGTLYHTPLQMMVFGGGPFNLQQGMLHGEIKSELDSLATPCFLVVGDDNEDIEGFKQKWAIATNQPYYWQDIIKAFFSGIFASVSNFFAGQKQKNELSDDIGMEFPSTPFNRSLATSSTTSYVAVSPVPQPLIKQEEEYGEACNLPEDCKLENTENSSKKTSWCNIL